MELWIINKYNTYVMTTEAVMAAECSFCAERCSTEIVQNELVLAHTDCKEMDLCLLECFLEQSLPFFDRPAPKLNSP